MEHGELEPITSFRGKWYRFSNFAPVRVFLDGAVYLSVEHAYQAAKTIDPLERNAIRLANTPGKSKQLGRQATIRSDWEYVKDVVMFDLLNQKFARAIYRILLIESYPREIIEGNSWGDTYWGVCNGVGQNKLGTMLMHLRYAILEEKRAITEAPQYSETG